MVSKVLKDIKINGKQYFLFVTHGIVADCQKHLEVKVSGSGGGGYINQGSGFASPTTIKSQTIVQDRILIIDEHNQEHAFTLYDWDLLYRSKNKLSVVECQKKDSRSKFILMICNHNTKTTKYNYKNIYRMLEVNNGLRHILVYFISYMIMAILTGNVFFAFLVWIIMHFIFKNFRRQKCEQRVQDFVNGSEIKRILEKEY